MSETKDLELLLKNIQKGLKFFSIKELSDNIMSFLKSKESKTNEINIILEIVQKEFSISLSKLKSNGRGELQDAKQIAYCLLHYDLGLSVRHISTKIFDNWHNSVLVALVDHLNPHKQVADFLGLLHRLDMFCLGLG